MIIKRSRPLLRLATLAGKLVATNVHAIRDLEDDDNRDFIVCADIALHERRSLALLGRGLGRGVKVLERILAIPTCPVVNTISAVDGFLDEASLNKLYADIAR